MRCLSWVVEADCPVLIVVVVLVVADILLYLGAGPPLARPSACTLLAGEIIFASWSSEKFSFVIERLAES